jgi:hypothetical protein
MYLIPDHSRFFRQSRSARGLFLRAALAGLAASVFTVRPAHGQTPITIPNFSFESPTTVFISTSIDDWTIPISQTAGNFVNTAVGQPNHINNLDGNQAAFILSAPTINFYQNLTATYTVGQQYTFSFGTISEAPVGDTLNLIAYYLNAGTMVPVATDTVTSQATNDITTLLYSSVTTPVVKSTDAWAGQPIGIEVAIGVGGTAQGGQDGDWDVDNITAVSAVPEPATAGLMALGLGVLLHRRRRTAAQA